MTTERGIDMSLSQQAQRLGFPITGALTRRSERERSRREQLYEDEAGNLYTCASPNQDNPLSEGKGWVPILAIDVWEHAYYLKYKNVRPDYIKAFWNVVDWKKVGEFYEKAIA